ncbi:MAG: C1 family peptidase [Planctomycetota bacterium]
MFGPQLVFPKNGARRGLGWLRDIPDFRDTTLDRLAPKLDTKENKPLHQRVAGPIRKGADDPASLPALVDHRENCSPIEDQGSLGSCTAQACAGMVEYMERRATGRHIDASRLFLYKVTRKLLGWTGDTGAFLRSTMKALVLFGIPPEECWAYDIATFENEPDPFLYSYAANYKALQYLRLDPPSLPDAEVRDAVRAALAAKYVVMFGFSVFSSLNEEPDIPYPSALDALRGGHAVLAVGYDDDRHCPNATPGALLIRNSWGTGWGDDGYGWLPYDFIVNGLATDFWTCFQMAWVDTNRFV